MTQHSKLLTTDEAAAVLKLHPDTLRHWRSTGSVDLPYIYIGRNVRYPADQLADYLTHNARRIPPAELKRIRTEIQEEIRGEE